MLCPLGREEIDKRPSHRGSRPAARAEPGRPGVNGWGLEARPPSSQLLAQLKSSGAGGRKIRSNPRKSAFAKG